jgi:hypothetical protein
MLAGKSVMETTDTQHLSALIERQWSILSALRLLAVHQADCLGADHVELLLSMIARKQPLLDELLQIQTLLNPYRGQDPDLRIWSDAAERERCKAMLVSCDQLHQEIVRLESHALDELEVQRSAVAAQLQECRDATLASSAYTSETILAESSFDLTNS